MKKVLLVLIISFLSLSISIRSMEKPECSPMELEKEEIKTGQILGLPKELWLNIVEIVSQSKNLRQAIKNIQQLSKANKAFYKLLNEPAVQRQLINKVSEYFNADVKDVETLFGLPAAKKSLDELLAKFKDANLFEAKDIIGKLIGDENFIALKYFFKNGMTPIEINQKISDNILSLISSYQADTEKKWKMMKFLINNGADINALNYEKNSILNQELLSIFMSLHPGHWFASPIPGKNVIANIEYLIDHGADVNEVNALGKTPLAMALIIAKRAKKYIKLVELLLDKGAEITNVDLHFAQDNDQLVNLLNKYKSK